MRMRSAWTRRRRCGLVNALLAAGVDGRSDAHAVRAASSGGSLPAGSVLFPALRESTSWTGRGKDSGMSGWSRITAGKRATRPLARGATGRAGDDVRQPEQQVQYRRPAGALRDLGFAPTRYTATRTRPLSNPAQPNPLDGYDVVYVSSGKAGRRRRPRSSAYGHSSPAGGGYIGSGVAGTTTSSGRPEPGSSTARRSSGGSAAAARAASSTGRTRRCGERDHRLISGARHADHGSDPWFSAVPPTASRWMRG